MGHKCITSLCLTCLAEPKSLKLIDVDITIINQYLKAVQLRFFFFFFLACLVIFF